MLRSRPNLIIFIEEELNVIKLLRVIKLICFNIEDEKYAPQKVHEKRLISMH
jgi:hypothetical protein